MNEKKYPNRPTMGTQDRVQEHSTPDPAEHFPDDDMPIPGPTPTDPGAPPSVVGPPTPPQDVHPEPDPAPVKVGK